MAQINGSFRGIPFGTYAHSIDGGRRAVTHEFPARDNPFTEDLGLRAKTLSLDLFVVGGDVSAQRDALQKALDAKGPGVLVHPYFGSLTVQVASYTLSESFDSMRLARFSVSFVQPGTLEFPSAMANVAATVAAASTAASLRAGANAAAIDVRKTAAAEALTLVVVDTVEAVKTSAKQAAKPKANPGLTVKSMSAFLRDANTIKGMLSNPDLMCFALADVIFRVSGLGMTGLEAFGAYLRLFNEAARLFGVTYPLTESGATMATNLALLRDATYVAVVGSAAANAVDADYGTYAEAISTREALAGMFDASAAVISDDALFGYLQDLRAQSLPQIPSPDQLLPSVVNVRVPDQMPSLVLAHDLMSGSGDENSLINLNGVRNPWFGPTQVLVLR